MNQICPGCGNSIEKDEKVCLHCGFVFMNQTQNNLNNNESSAFSNNQNSVFVFNNHEKKRNVNFEHNNLTWFLIGILIGLFAGVIVGASITYMLHSKKSDVQSKVNVNNIKEVIERDISSEKKVSASKKQTESTNGQLNNKNRSLILCDEQNVFVKLDKMIYVEGASDVEFWFEINNQSKSIIEVGFSDITIDGTIMHLQFGDTEEYKVGAVDSIYRISLEDLANNGLTNFKNISCTIFGKFKDSDIIFEKEVKIDRDAFIENGF